MHRNVACWCMMMCKFCRFKQSMFWGWFSWRYGDDTLSTCTKALTSCTRSRLSASSKLCRAETAHCIDIAVLHYLLLRSPFNDCKMLAGPVLTCMEHTLMQSMSICVQQHRHMVVGVQQTDNGVSIQCSIVPGLLWFAWNTCSSLYDRRSNLAGLLSHIMCGVITPLEHTLSTWSAGV